MKYADMLAANIETLREHYGSCRALAFNNARIAQAANNSRGKLARQMGYLMRQVSMCENAARKRGERL